ncbi:MAG: NAD(P)/FAD-dependent oxidoreductase [bacterium]
MQIDTLIIGAGPAGLAVGACLRRAGVPFEIVDRADRVGSAWHRHYARLRLHTARRFSALPHRPFPPGTPAWVPRLDFVRYLTDYAEAFELHPRFGVTVTGLARAGDGWRVETDGEPIAARRVVVATGFNRIPHRPPIAGLDDFAGEVLHTRDYHDGAPWRGRDVLVVGCGNSGAEIAIDLFEHGARPAMVVRGPVHVVDRELCGQPAQNLTVALSKLPYAVQRAIHGLMRRFVLPDLAPLGFTRPAESVLDHFERTGRVPLIDIGTVAHVRAGHIAVVPGIERVERDAVRFVDGRRRPVDAIVLATGYRTGLADLFGGADLFDDRGRPRWHGRAVPGWPGLWFVGFRNPLTGALREMGMEARRVAAEIVTADGRGPSADGPRTVSNGV